MSFTLMTNLEEKFLEMMKSGEIVMIFFLPNSIWPLCTGSKSKFPQSLYKRTEYVEVCSKSLCAGSDIVNLFYVEPWLLNPHQYAEQSKMQTFL